MAKLTAVEMTDAERGVCVKVLDSMITNYPETPEGWIKFCLCLHAEVEVDTAIDTLLDARIVESTVIAHSHAAGLRFAA